MLGTEEDPGINFRTMRELFRCLPLPVASHLASSPSAVPHCQFFSDPLGALQPQCMPDVTGLLHSCLPALASAFSLPTTPLFCVTNARRNMDMPCNAVTQKALL